jgi:hypothetical protein
MTWTSRKKKTETPVMRWRTQVHLPSPPRYSVPTESVATRPPLVSLAGSWLLVPGVAPRLARFGRGGAAGYMWTSYVVGHRRWGSGLA